ncbi:MAG: YdcF family protein [Rhodospirillales bacterium]|jgi:uncharacterized SAM-binding protein YcdF (DUF218 family)|nr:YdcF family protein [Rhodospirillales bacterium]MBT4039035.1 YdcF family protein [Rhodospirillales bacterium]MBT4625287.1 YdcF family protein [Rhodospirillales bacterium]MBT5352560.1 YdcF family protein [Rhodospirillales bacterium]MBT5520801.1 YdcF family protein [Rhodospirillales bacterium]
MARPRPPRRRPNKTLAAFCGVAVVLVAAWCYGLITFANSIPKYVEDPDRQTDVIVVLTGGSGRLETGLDLLQADMAEMLFVSGVYQGIDVNYLLTLFREDPDHLAARVEIGNAVDTRGNASETAEWASQRNVQSVRLVTAAYHMPRSMLELAHAMPNMRLIANPVFPDHVKEQWWRWPGTAGLVIKEYNKYLLVWLRHFAANMIAIVSVP